MITKKAIVQAATEVAGRAPTARNSSPRMVDRRHPRGLIGRTLHTAGLTPKQIRSLEENRRFEQFLNPAATQWLRQVSTRAGKGVTWSEAVSTTR